MLLANEFGVEGRHIARQLPTGVARAHTCNHAPLANVTQVLRLRMTHRVPDSIYGVS